MARMSNKLTGRDFSTCSSIASNSIQHSVDHNSLIAGDSREVDHGLSVKLQVQKLIIQATSHENLCQNYVGYEVTTFHWSFTSISSFLLCYLTFLVRFYTQNSQTYHIINVSQLCLLCFFQVVSLLVISEHVSTMYSVHILYIDLIDRGPDKSRFDLLI